jgi:hypothetical protein
MLDFVRKLVLYDVAQASKMRKGGIIGFCIMVPLCIGMVMLLTEPGADRKMGLQFFAYFGAFYLLVLQSVHLYATGIQALLTGKKNEGALRLVGLALLFLAAFAAVSYFPEDLVLW